jgi:hypothetical protein
MSYNGSGTFLINSAGQPVVTGTTITTTAFNALTADLATGLSTAITKDGQTTPTANIPMGGFRITGLGNATGAGDAVGNSRPATGTGSGSAAVISVAGSGVGNSAGYGWNMDSGIADSNVWDLKATNARTLILRTLSDANVAGSTAFVFARSGTSISTGQFNAGTSLTHATPNFYAGVNGTTNPGLYVNTSAGSAATGVQVTAAAAGGGVAVAAISSGTNENLTIDAKGSGAITLGGTSTGNIVASRAFVPNQTAGIVGTTTNNDASAGSIGEFISSNISLASATSLTDSTAKNVTSISLTAGDWDVWGNIGYLVSGATPSNLVQQLTSSSAASPIGEPAGGGYSQVPNVQVGNTTISAGFRRFSLSGTTTVYLVGYAEFGVGSVTVYGFIGARRVR